MPVSLGASKISQLGMPVTFSLGVRCLNFHYNINIVSIQYLKKSIKVELKFKLGIRLATG